METLKFFVILNKQLNFGMSYTIEKIPSGKFFIKLISRDWKFIINSFKPYFNEIYGDKNKGLKRLEYIYLLMSELLVIKGDTNVNDNTKKLLYERIILLAYNLVDYSKRKQSILNYFKLFNIIPSQNIDFFNILENENKVNNYFLLGFILGDGNIYIRIRESKGFPWLIPNIRIGQKITDDNLNLLNIIKNTLEENNILANISKRNHLLVISINNIKNVDKLMRWLPNNADYWFWKK